MLQSNFCLNIRRKIRSLCLTAISQIVTSICTLLLMLELYLLCTYLTVLVVLVLNSKYTYSKHGNRQVLYPKPLTSSIWMVFSNPLTLLVKRKSHFSQSSSKNVKPHHHLETLYYQVWVRKMSGKNSQNQSCILPLESVC